MRAVVQRVLKAEVKNQTREKVVGSVGKGYLVLIGIKKGDKRQNAEVLADRVSKLRVMADEGGKMNLSLEKAGGSVLVISQFTLHADTSAGNRPSFINAEDHEKAEQIYLHFIKSLREKNITVETGSFGEYMEISTTLDGPVTILYSD